ncbi:MAG: hypothetical protein HYY40_13985 [Bacteroidetes bacterium]|nr:hypothetical protein [Bacteroidota bacterium]
MEAKSHRNINGGEQYDSLFPVANLNDETVKKGATVSDTVKFIPKVVRETLPQTKKIAYELRGNSLSETCKKIWDFVYNHIRYEKDDEGKEQIRSPARTWNDRHRGVDCDCYTVFISSILTNLKIPHRLRIARYKKDFFQHIYPVVPKANGRHITIDCVVDYFNYEEPYTEIKDTTMDLQYLSGINDGAQFFNETEELGKRKKEKGKGKVKEFFKKAVHTANRANPATVLLRNGVLAAMKLNIFKVAQRLKYAYLSDEEAKKRGVDIGKFQKLKTIREKLEKIFYGAGGKPENLKKAILTGRGNKNKDVSGPGYSDSDYDFNDMNEATPLPQLLGHEIFNSENTEGLGELGEPVTAASITAASGAIAAIAGLLKSIGNIFPKKEKGTEDFENTEGEGDEKNLPAEIEKNKEEISKMEMDSSKDTSNEKSSGGDSSGGEDDSKKEGFWDKNKKWLKPTLWGAGGLGLLYAGYRMLGGKKEETSPQKTLTGTKHKKHHHKKKSEVALM